MIDLILTDMDGTLLDNESRLSEENIETIKAIKKSGIEFGLATGRAMESIERIIKLYNIGDYVDHIISLNGVAYYNKKTDKTIVEPFLKQKTISDIYNKYKKYSVSFAVGDSGRLYYSKVENNSLLEKEIYNYLENVVDDFEAIINKDFPKFMLVGDGKVLDEIERGLEENKIEGINYFRSLDTFLEIVTKDVSKGSMLKKICTLNGIDINRVMALGDNLNDIDMVKCAGIGVAVANAHKKVIEEADVVTLSNEENGFSHICRKYLPIYAS